MNLHNILMENGPLCILMLSLILPLILLYLLSLIIFWPSYVKISLANAESDYLEPPHHWVHNIFLLSTFLEFFNLLFLSIAIFHILCHQIQSPPPLLLAINIFLLSLSLCIIISLIMLYQAYLSALSLMRFVFFVRPVARQINPARWRNTCFVAFLGLFLFNFGMRFTKLIRVISGESVMDQEDDALIVTVYHIITTTFLITSFLYLPPSLCVQNPNLYKSDGYLWCQTLAMTAFKLFYLAAITLSYFTYSDVSDNLIYMMMLFCDFLITPIVIHGCYLLCNLSDTRRLWSSCRTSETRVSSVYAPPPAERVSRI